MSRKHHVAKSRSQSNYKQRLADRGLGKAPIMPDVEKLRVKQERERLQRGAERAKQERQETRDRHPSSRTRHTRRRDSR